MSFRKRAKMEFEFEVKEVDVRSGLCKCGHAFSQHLHRKTVVNRVRDRYGKLRVQDESHAMARSQELGRCKSCDCDYYIRDRKVFKRYRGERTNLLA